jgi:hypothetical protein
MFHFESRAMAQEPPRQIMKRRDILTTSVGAVMASAIGVSVFGQPSSAPSQSEDGAATRRSARSTASN